jgi:glycosyltransferase involved in cell wall biosynthesis
MKRSILHISPTYYSEKSVIGGGEKYIAYMSRAINAAAASRQTEIQDSMLAFGQSPALFQLAGGLSCEVIEGRPWDPYSIDVSELAARISRSDILVVHQCLSAFGLFAASHGRLANKVVVGIDEGGGEHALVNHSPEIGSIFDMFLAYSRFCANSFRDIHGRVEIILGPVDTSYYRPDNTVTREPALVLAVGRILPHKGFDRIIRALPAGLRLVIAGTNYDQEYYSYLIQVAGSSRVEIREHLTDDEILFLMQRASLFVHASTSVDYRGQYYAKPELLGLAPLEALGAGTPALVSSAGALPELATIAGCLHFADDAELAALLNMHADSASLFPPPDVIHNDVEAKYGLRVFGGRFLDAVGECRPSLIL